MKLWITTSLSKTTIFWDVGGCVGNFSIYAARTGSRVLVFEPDGLTYSSLLTNTFNSNLKNISVYPIALGNHDKFSSLIMKKFEIANAYNSVENPESPIDRSIIPEYEQNVCEYKASTLISNHAFPVPTHIKIDVDGNELEVLLGFGDFLYDPKIVSVFIELDSQNIKSRDCDVLLRKFGFKLQPHNFDSNSYNHIYQR